MLKVQTSPCTFPLAEALGLKVANGFVLLDAIKVVRRLVLDCHVAGSAGGSKHCISHPARPSHRWKICSCNLGILPDPFSYGKTHRTLIQTKRFKDVDHHMEGNAVSLTHHGDINTYPEVRLSVSFVNLSYIRIWG